MSSSSFSDDELAPAVSSAGARPTHQVVRGGGGGTERVRLVAHCNGKAPLEENRQPVLLELIDTSSPTERAGLDLVAVLDVSGSMKQGGKLDNLKTAMKFVISKLGPKDRLSIVSFADEAERLCPLRWASDDAKRDMAEIVETGLNASGTTNMKAGLETGLSIVRRRRLWEGRAASVVLMSDGAQNKGEDNDARTVRPIDDVPVYTFGFGANQDAQVLEAIAGNSVGGTFYDVKHGENLSVHFSALLAGLLSVVVQDLKLTVWDQPGDSEIEAVDAGSYLKPPGDVGRQRSDSDRSVTVSFGDLYSGEVRKVIVDLLLLPAVRREYRATVLLARCTYSIQGRAFRSPHGGDGLLRCDIRRSRSAIAGAMDREVEVERIRRRHAVKIGEAAATKDTGRAHSKLSEADMALVTAMEGSKLKHHLLDMLRAELAKLIQLTKTTWEVLLAALLASKRSHDTQRFASRGDVDVGLFKPKLLDQYVDQATKFEEDPSRPPPSVEDDVRVETPPQVLPYRPTAWKVWSGTRDEQRRSGWWAWAVVLLCTALAIAVILAGAAVFAVYLLYRPRMPYLALTDARLELLQYTQDGAIDYLQVSITVLAVNNNSKADAAFPAVDLALGFNGADVALLRAEPFVVPRESSLPLPYNVVSAGRPLDAAGMQAMEEALQAGVVPLDLWGKARTRWKVGVFVRLRFWTRVSCRLRFFFPGNGTVMPADRDKCRSRSP